MNFGIIPMGTYFVDEVTEMEILGTTKIQKDTV